MWLIAKLRMSKGQLSFQDKDIFPLNFFSVVSIGEALTITIQHAMLVEKRLRCWHASSDTWQRQSVDTINNRKHARGKEITSSFDMQSWVSSQTLSTKVQKPQHEVIYQLLFLSASALWKIVHLPMKCDEQNWWQTLTANITPYQMSNIPENQHICKIKILKFYHHGLAKNDFPQ